MARIDVSFAHGVMMRVSVEELHVSEINADYKCAGGSRFVPMTMDELADYVYVLGTNGTIKQVHKLAIEPPVDVIVRSAALDADYNIKILHGAKQQRIMTGTQKEFLSCT